MKYVFSALITGLFILAGVAASLYFCLYGGVVNVVDGLADPVNAGLVGLGVVRVLITSVCVWVSIVLPSSIMLFVGGIFASMDD